jgi:hypothetical protein
MKPVTPEIKAIQDALINSARMEPEEQMKDPALNTAITTLESYAQKGSEILIAFSPTGESKVRAEDSAMFTIMAGSWDRLGGAFASMIGIQPVYETLAVMLGALIANGTIIVKED